MTISQRGNLTLLMQEIRRLTDADSRMFVRGQAAWGETVIDNFKLDPGLGALVAVCGRPSAAS